MKGVPFGGGCVVRQLRRNPTMRKLRSASIQLALVRDHQEEGALSRQSSDCNAELSKLRGWIDEEAAFRSHSEW
jgi:hypothetical protein